MAFETVILKQWLNGTGEERRVLRVHGWRLVWCDLLRFRSTPAGFNPTQQHIVFPRTCFEPLATFVFDLFGRLLNEQAVADVLQVNPVAIGRRRRCVDRGVVGSKVETKQRQTKVTLPLKRPVALGRITAKAAK